MEQPFEGLQERTNEQMERKKNRKREALEQQELEHREKKARERVLKKRAKAKAEIESTAAKKRQAEQETKRVEREATRKKLSGDAETFRKKKAADREAYEEDEVRKRYPFAPQIPEGNIEAVLAQPDNYEDVKTTKIKAQVNEARRNLYRARAARAQAEEVVKRELRSSSHTSLARAVLDNKHDDGGKDNGKKKKDPAGVNLSLLTRRRQELKGKKAKEREAEKRVKKVERQAAKQGVEVAALSEEAQALLDGQQVFAFMTDEYKEDERRRKQKGRERQARRAVSGATLTKAQKQEFERQRRMKEIVRKNKEEGRDGPKQSKRVMLINDIFEILNESGGGGENGVR